MSQLFSNNAESTLSAALSNSATTATVADGSVFKAPTGGDFELLTLLAAGVYEIVKVTARTSNTLTIVRAQEGTTARNWASGTSIFAGVTAGSLASLIANQGTGFSAIAIGDDASATGMRAVAVGELASANFSNVVAVGSSAGSTAANAVAVGAGANVYAAGSAALGYQNAAYGSDALVAGRGVTSYGNQSVALGEGGFIETEGTRAVAIGRNVYAGGPDAIAIGALSDVDYLVAGGFAFGDTAVITDRSMQAAALPVVPRANGVEADAAWRMAGSASVICSAAISLKTLQAYTITLPAGVTFFPEEVGVIVTAASGVTGQPTLQFGITGTAAKFVAATETVGLTAAHARHRFTSLLSSDGAGTLRAEVTVAATGTTLTGRIYWRGFAVVNAA